MSPAHRSRSALFLVVLALFFSIGAANPIDSPRPKKKDTPSRLKPSGVAFETAVSPPTARPGDTVVLKVKAKVESPWHIYAYEATEQETPGPVGTQFDLFDPAGLRVEGGWSADKKPIREEQDIFPDREFVEYHEGEVTWSLPLLVPRDATPGERRIRCQIRFMICDPSRCLPAARVTLPDAVLLISEDDPQ